MKGPAATAALCLALMAAAPAAARLVVYTSQSCDQGGGEPMNQMFGPPACPSSIWDANADGSGARRLTTGDRRDWVAGDFNPFWSPDGTIIVFERRVAGGGGSRLWAVRPDGSDLHPLTTGDDPGTDEGPEFSPDGLRIAFTRVANGYASLTVGTVALDGTGFALIAQGSAQAFSPDSRRVLYETSGATYTVGIDGSGPGLAFAGTAPPSFMSPDGRAFAWLTRSNAVAVADLHAGRAEVVTPQGFFPGAFSLDDPGILNVANIAGGLHEYEVDVFAPGHPHRKRRPQAVPDSMEQPTGRPPTDEAAFAPIAFGFVDPYPAAYPGQTFGDPWAGDNRGMTRRAPTSSRRLLDYSAFAYAGLRSVWFSVAHRVGHDHCSYFTGRRFLIHGRCGRTHWRKIPSAAWWAAGTKHLPHGGYEVRFRAIDSRGKRSKSKRRVVHL